MIIVDEMVNLKQVRFNAQRLVGRFRFDVGARDLFTLEISFSVSFRTPPLNLPTEEKRMAPTSPWPRRFCFDCERGLSLLFGFFWKRSPNNRA